MKPELLSPAGDIEALKAAIYGGCDAIYMGGPKYSARAYATNFTDEDLKASIDYAHTYSVKTYITINTLLKDTELEDAYRYALKVWNMGADAIIIQDPGLIYLLSKYNPKVELHASTQMTVHNEGSALFYKDRGMKRIVLSRELSLEEIKRISDKVETEIFIHGALCVCYSGKCLMSSALSSRSGNRGRCAQNCRMEYTLTDSLGDNIAKGYLLSPKDLSTLEILDKVISTGTSSLKIEGRMKRKEYVYKTVSEYRNVLSGKRGDLSGIAQIFNREGFTDAFLIKHPGRDYIAASSPKNSGIRMGEVRKGTVTLSCDLNTGDGVKCGSSGFIVTKIMKRGEAVRSAQRGDTVTVFPKSYKDGDVLYRTSDSELLKLIEERLKERFPKRIPLTIDCTFMPGEPLKLIGNADGITFEVTGDIPEEPLNDPLTKERIETSLRKSGDTPFEVTDVTFAGYSDAFMRVSQLNAARRNLQENLLNMLIRTYHDEKPSDGAIDDIYRAADKADPVKIMTLSMKDQLRAFIDTEHSDIIPAFYPFYRSENALKKKDVKDFDESGQPYYIRCPEILRDDLDEVMRFIESLKNVTGVITDNPAVMDYFRDSGLTIIGDTKLNIANSISMKLYDPLKYYTPSSELDRNEIKSLKYKDNAVLRIYGRTEMMISEYCPVGAFAGGRKKGTECSVPCVRRDFSLLDIKGETFPLLTDGSCRCSIFNSRAENNMDMMRQFRSDGYSSFRADLTDESYEDTIVLISDFLNEERTLDREFTRGHFKRGVE